MKEWNLSYNAAARTSFHVTLDDNHLSATMKILKQYMVLSLFILLAIVTLPGCFPANGSRSSDSDSNSDEQMTNIPTSPPSPTPFMISSQEINKTNGETSAILHKIRFLSESMMDQKFSVGEAYQAVLSEHPDWLHAYPEAYGKAKSIFHHALEAPLNTVTFSNIEIEIGTRLLFETGIFSGGYPDFSSTGVLFTVNVIDSAGIVAKELLDILKENNIVNHNGNSGHEFYVSDHTEYFEIIAKMFFGEKINLKKIALKS